MDPVCRLRYTGATPGADSNTYSLFDSAVAFPAANMAQAAGTRRFRLALKNSQAGTIKGYRSESRISNPNLATGSMTWTQFYEQAVAAAAATGNNTLDAMIEEFADFKFEWVNGGSAQATWTVDMALDSSRNPPA
jgi:hypothetical protein